MQPVRSVRGVALATLLGVAFAFPFSLAGCGSSSTDGGTPAAVSPEIEAKTKEMLKNKSKEYNERYRAKGRR